MGSRRSLLTSALALALLGTGGAASARQTDREAAAGVTPKNNGFPPGDVRRYGAMLDGGTDDTAALADWARVGGRLVFPVPGTARISAPIRLVSGTTIEAADSARLQLTVADSSFLFADGQSSINIKGLHFEQKEAGAQAYVAGVLLSQCQDCTIENCEFEGLQWAGVYLRDSSNCAVRGNYFHGATGDVPDAADVCVHQRSHGNLVDGNRLDGGGCHGILCQDPYTGLVPTSNVFSNNQVGRHTSYGIAVYCPGPGAAGDSNNRIVGNTITEIQGSYARNRSAGTGIYVVGPWSGGTQVIGNTVANCCVRTRDRTLAPAGIGIAGIPAEVTQVIVSGNIVNAMSQGDGILVVSSPGGCAISGGLIEVPKANAGRGPGGAELLGCGIRVENSSHVRVRDVRVAVEGEGSALLVYARDAIVEDVSIESGEFSSSGSGPAMRFEGSGRTSMSHLFVDAAHAEATAQGSAIHIAGVSGGRLSNVVASAHTRPALELSASSDLKVSGGSYSASASVAVRIAGDCTGSSMDGSVGRSGSPSAVDNAGLGFRVE
jgi:parallel beta-helix repeat protein